MPSLPGNVCAYIVGALACYDSPQQVATDVKAKFDLTLTRQRIECWDPEKRAGARLRDYWRTMFYEVRQRLHGELEGIPIAHRSYRLRRMGKMALQAEEMGNIALAADIIRQAAKEVGDMYVKRQSV